MTPQLQRELWTSWASLLRSYAAVHSLGKPHHAVVEVSLHEILLRYGTRTLRFTPATYTDHNHSVKPFALTEDGRARIGVGTNTQEDEMDLFAERLASAIMVP